MAKKADKENATVKKQIDLSKQRVPMEVEPSPQIEEMIKMKDYSNYQESPAWSLSDLKVNMAPKFKDLANSSESKQSSSTLVGPLSRLKLSDSPELPRKPLGNLSNKQESTPIQSQQSKPKTATMSSIKTRSKQTSKISKPPKMDKVVT